MCTLIPPAQQHSLLEDLQPLFSATLMIALAINLYTTAGLLTGGTAGLGFLLSYATPISFGVGYFLINLPFYVLAFRRMGCQFDHPLDRFNETVCCGGVSEHLAVEAIPSAMGGRPPDLDLLSQHGLINRHSQNAQIIANAAELAGVTPYHHAGTIQCLPAPVKRA